MKNPYVLGISGSLRRESFSTAILRSIAEAMREEYDFDVFTLADIPPYNQDDDLDPAPGPVARLRAAIGRADGIVISSPEYNHGVPGVLKNALDWASRPYNAATLTGRSVLIVTSSPGIVGGVRAHAQLNETLGMIGARVLVRPQAVVPSVHTKIVEGRFVDDTTIAFLREGVVQAVREQRLVAFPEEHG